MRLHEIAQINEVTAFQVKTLINHDWKNPKEVVKWLRSKGFKQKGAGQFGAAYVHPSYKRIVKISLRQDKCWLRFAHWTLKMTSNPSVPYMDWVRVYGEGDEFFIAVIEKLAPFNKKAIMNTVDLPGLAYMYMHEEWFEGNHDIYQRLDKEGLLGDDPDHDDYWLSEEALIKRYLKSIKTGKRFIRTLKRADDFAKGECSYDMHDGNIMYRPSDRRLVIIDPLADLSELGFFF